MFATGSGGFYILIALGVVAVALGVTWFALNYTPLRPPFEFGAVDALIGIVYGVLLAILVLFASQHYTTALEHSDQEATALNSVYKAAGTLQPAVRNTIRHEVVCYAREKIELEWPALRKSNGTGSAEVFARTRELNQTVEEAARANPDSLIVSTLFNANLERGAARQLMLEDSRPQLPLPLWFEVLTGIGIVVFLLAIRYWHEPAHLVAVLFMSLLLLLSMVGALAELDRPFAPIIGLQPRGMESVLTSVVQSSSSAGNVLRPCTPLTS